MDIEQILNALTPDIYHRFKQAIEIGKWPDGRKLSADQKELCLQAVIAYDLQNKPESERVGFIAPKAHTHCGSTSEPELEDKPISWKH